MKTALTCLCAILVVTVTIFFCNRVIAGEQDRQWRGSLNDGKVIDEEELRKIIVEHEKWLNNPNEGKRADLEDANLNKADLQGVILRNANLKNADLIGANLQAADLTGANLQEADLNRAILCKADLSNASLQKTRFIGADLHEAYLINTNLLKANLTSANLQDANLISAFLNEADLISADFRKAYLNSAFLHKADLSNASLQETHLNDAVLTEADLKEASLQTADLSRSDIQKANLKDTNLENAKFSKANLKGTIFEAKPNSLPDILRIAEAVNIPMLKYEKSPHALVELRSAFKKFGLRRQEREITYAIKHSGFENALEEGNLLTTVEVLLGWFFFEMTCKWGMVPERPLFLLLGLILLFTIPYAQAISQDLYGKEKTDGIWKVWIPGRVRDDLGKKKPKELLESISPGFCFKIGFYFSVLSAFNIGWRDLNVGNWISRMQPYEYQLKGTGWARYVSGFQSIISVYLLALSVLAYFGRPFESY